MLSPRTLTSIEDSDVYRMLLKDQEEPQEPRQSGSFKALQEFIDSDGELFLPRWCISSETIKAFHRNFHTDARV